jgi:hypothetical protein
MADHNCWKLISVSNVMDSNNFLSSSIGGVSVALCLALAYAVYKAINHTRCRSMCCKKEMAISLDIEPTTPKSLKTQLSNLPSIQNDPTTS